MDSGIIFLSRPYEGMKDAVMQYRSEHIDCGEHRIHGSCGLIHYDDFSEWLKNVREMEKIRDSEQYVPSDTYLAIRKKDNRLVGMIQLRHYLNDSLKVSGGHIGYGIRPSERGNGYSIMQLNLVLNEARKLNITEVMITCGKKNITSVKTAVRCGAVFAKEFHDESINETIQQYWIKL